MIHTRLELRNHIRTVTRLTTSENALIEDMINLTVNEINDYHTWTFNRRSTTFDTVATIEDYVLDRDIDQIGLIRQTESPIKIIYVPDEIFYRRIPSPTATGNPKYYRIWDYEGVSTRLATADTIDIVSSSASDGSTFSVTIQGTDSNNTKVSETYSLNGTTAVTGSTTFKANMPLIVSKSADTTGNITVSDHDAGDGTLVILGPQERSPRFKVISLYPIPSSAITISIEYYSRIKELTNDTDTPSIPNEWHWLVREGALAKIYQQQNKINDYAACEGRYQGGLKKMMKRDILTMDYIPHLQKHYPDLNKLWDVEDYTVS